MPEFSDHELERYSRQIILREFGGAGQARLKSSHVAVIGAGGIGCPVIEALTLAGVGRLTIVDGDTIALSNLARQSLFREADIGRGKALAAAEWTRAANGDVIADAVETHVTQDNAGTIVAGADLVIDGTDNFATRLVVADACVSREVPLLSAAIGRFQGQIGLFRGHEPGQPCYRCFVGDAYDSDDCDACAEMGVLGSVTGLVGYWAATEAIRALGGFGADMAGRLLLIDALAPSMRVMTLPKDPACRTCGSAA